MGPLFVIIIIAVVGLGSHSKSPIKPQDAISLPSKGIVIDSSGDNNTPVYIQRGSIKIDIN